MIAFKDTEMPRGCVSCDFCADDWCCKIQHKYINNFVPNDNNRHPNCPLIEIGTCKDCKQLGVMDCGYYCKLYHWGKISKESNYGGMGDFYCADFEKRGDKA